MNSENRALYPFIGREIKNIREFNHITQEDLSNMSGASKDNGKEIIFGIRPEDVIVNLENDSISNDNYKARIDLSELLGSESMFYVKIGEIPLIIKANKEKYIQNDYMNIGFNLDKSHIFDANTGQSLVRKH